MRFGITPSCTSPMKTPLDVRDGRAKNYRAKQSGSLPRAADSTAQSSLGATTWNRTEKAWQRPGRVNFRGGSYSKTDTGGRRLLEGLRRMVMDSTQCRANR